MLIVAKIHNNSLGRCVQVSSWEEGLTTIKTWFKDQFEREMDQEESESLENTYEVSNFEDFENTYGFSIGEVEIVENFSDEIVEIERSSELGCEVGKVRCSKCSSVVSFGGMEKHTCTCGHEWTVVTKLVKIEPKNPNL